MISRCVRCDFVDFAVRASTIFLTHEEKTDVTYVGFQWLMSLFDGTNF